MSDLGQEFDNLQPHEQHAFLSASSPEYAKMSGLDQARYLAHTRGEVMPQDAKRGPGGVTNDKVFMGTDAPLDLKRYAVDRGAAIATAPTAVLGPLPGAAVRTGIQAVAGGINDGWQGAGIRGGVNALIEAAPPVVGALVRNTPGIKGWLAGRAAARATAAQEVENQSAASANTAAQDAFKTSEASRKTETVADNKQTRQLFDMGEANRKDAGDRAAKAENALGMQAWLDKKKSAEQTADVANRMSRWDTKNRNTVGQAEAEAQAADRNQQAGERVRGVLEKQVPGQPLGSRGDVQTFGYGEQGLAHIKDQLDAGQAQIVKQIGGQQLRLPSMGKPGEATMPFEEAWMRAGQLRGPARDQAFDEIFSELRRLNPGGGASGMFAQLRDVYNAAKVHQGVAKNLTEPTGGDYSISRLADWMNKRRDVLFRRLGPDRYEELANSVFRRPVGGGDPTARPDFTPSPMPAKIPPMIPDKPIPARAIFSPRTPPESVPFQPGQAPAKVEPRELTPDAQLVNTPGLLNFLLRRVPVVRHMNMGKSWEGPNLPLNLQRADPLIEGKRDTATQTLWQMLMQRNQENFH